MTYVFASSKLRSTNVFCLSQTPFLTAIAVEQVQDVRPLLKPFVGKDSSEIAAAYKAKVSIKPNYT